MELWEILGFAVAVIAMGASCSAFFGERSISNPVVAKVPEALVSRSSDVVVLQSMADRACFGAGC